MLVDQKGLGKPPVFSGKEEDFYVWTKKDENYVSAVFPNMRGALSFAVESQDLVQAAAVALGVPELDAETSAERDEQLFIVLSALTDGESFDVVTSAGGDQGFGSWRKLHKRWCTHTAGRARSLLRVILSPPRAKLLELMGAIQRMEDLVRRCGGGRDAQGNPHTFADDVRMRSPEALVLDDLEKHVQLNRARLDVEKSKTYCECRGHARARSTEPKGPSHPGGDDPMESGALGNGKGKRGKGQRQRTARTARQGQGQGQEQGLN